MDPTIAAAFTGALKTMSSGVQAGERKRKSIFMG